MRVGVKLPPPTTMTAFGDFPLFNRLISVEIESASRSTAGLIIVDDFN